MKPQGRFKDDPEQRERWYTMQTNSASSKALRGAILRMLPSWFVDAAFHAAKQVADGAIMGKYKTLEEARAAALKVLGERGCTKEELEKFVDQPVEMWAIDQLGIVLKLLQQLRDKTLSVEQWRADLNKEAVEAPEPPKGGRGALGLPSGDKHAADNEALRAAVQANEEADKAASQKEGPQQAELGEPGPKSKKGK